MWKKLRNIINEHQKKGCQKNKEFWKEFSHLKLYSPLQNVTKGVYLAKCGNILEFWTKTNALLNIRHSHPSSTLAL
jgi:predicted phosphoadenosine phosphosulfate sulfurtransferase